MLIGPDFKPFYPWMQGKDLGVTTWPGEMWKQGASAPWGWVSYDPDLNEDLLRHLQSGTAHAVAAAGPQSVERGGVRARRRYRRGEMGLSVHAA